ncbi:MAG TPA: glycosyltransferase family 2 protein [Thermodesulfobacteriota bacterium]|nr:glycosyltransferase family 2 protein [Thermodesulfobacteriota bacterium]
MGYGLDSNKRIGEVLVDRGLIRAPQLQKALQLQKKWGGKIGEILVANGDVRRIDFYRFLSRQLSLPFLDLSKEEIQPKVIHSLDFNFMKRKKVVPVRIERGKLLLGMCDPNDELTEEEVKDIVGLPIRKAVITELDLLWALEEHFKSELKRNSIELLQEVRPDFSAKRMFAGWQILGFFVISSVVLYLCFFKPVLAFVLVNSAIQILFFLSIAYKLYLTLLGANIDAKSRDEELRALKDEELPVYTILLPLYREVTVLPNLIDAIWKLDYPKSKLDVKVLFEEDDTETLNAAKGLRPEGFFEFLVVPKSYPKTKPKACNWGLQFARGKYITIFDAEDEPEPDQLRKAVLAFRKASPDTVCLQARLNYYNPDENFLTRMFTLEYSYWFDYLLPGLESLRVPIPLGGTSNHFITERLIELGGWDAFNVTEDADIGIRAARMGKRVETLDSTTYEEAVGQVKNWINQRSRWIKGYMQTYVVHMRHPLRLLRELGLKGFISFQLFIGGTPFATLVNPVIWVVYFFIWYFTRIQVIHPAFPAWILYLSLLNLVISNGMLIFMNMIAGWRREFYKLVPWALLNPIYWVLLSLAAWKAQWQILREPFYWEKTEHGISKSFEEEKAYLNAEA